MTSTASPLRWALDKGGEARVLESDGDHVSLESSRAFPPGAPLLAKGEGTGEPYRVKVRACRRTSETTFYVDGRFVSLPREARERLLAALGGGSGA